MTALTAPGIKKPELHTKKVPFDIIISETAEYYHLETSDILGKDRYVEISLARQISMYLCRYYNPEVTLGVIGKKFKKGHDTVSKNIKKIKGYIDVDEVIQKDVERIKMNILFN